ncbi:MAG TPA: AI-2E family transporter [Patescibacteria group bacterium]|nr:AI-2E family transporter [Patescibacteria group bacterium]
MAEVSPAVEPETISRVPINVRSASVVVLAGVAILVFLKFAQEFFIPLVLGVLISYTLDPIVSRLQKWSIPRALGAGILLAALVGGLGFGIYTLRDDAVQVIEKLPPAAIKLRESMRVTRRDGRGLMDKVQAAATEVEKTTTEAFGPDAARDGVTRVTVEDKPVNVGDYLWWGGTGAVAVLSQAILVLFLVYFLLIAGDLFKRKLVKIAGPTVFRRRITTQILNEIDTQIARYLLVQILMSILVGVISGIVFWWAGLEQAPVWAIAAGLFVTIPYFGPAIVMGGIFTISFLQFGTMLTGLYLAGLFLIITVLEGSLLKPWLMGRAMRMNGPALFLGLMFWGWMWGIWGLLLAVPIIVMIKSICDRVEDLKTIGELLGE